jgi:hypothetical protein
MDILRYYCADHRSGVGYKNTSVQDMADTGENIGSLLRQAN